MNRSLLLSSLLLSVTLVPSAFSMFQEYPSFGETIREESDSTIREEEERTSSSQNVSQNREENSTVFAESKNEELDEEADFHQKLVPSVLKEAQNDVLIFNNEIKKMEMQRDLSLEELRVFVSRKETLRNLWKQALIIYRDQHNEEVAGICSSVIQAIETHKVFQEMQQRVGEANYYQVSSLSMKGGLSQKYPDAITNSSKQRLLRPRLLLEMQSFSNSSDVSRDRSDSLYSASRNYGSTSQEQISFQEQKELPSLLDETMELLGNPIGKSINLYQRFIKWQKAQTDGDAMVETDH